MARCWEYGTGSAAGGAPFAVDNDGEVAEKRSVVQKTRVVEKLEAMRR